jgi:DNA-binding CsgD family transcriptional regulator
VGDGLPLGCAVGDTVGVGTGVGEGVGMPMPPPGGAGIAGMPPFVLHAARAAQSATAAKAAANGLNMAQEGYTWLIRAYPAWPSKRGVMRQRRSEATDSLQQARDDFQRARFADASERLNARLRSAPNDIDAALLLARVELRRGSPETALSILTRYVRTPKRLAKAEAALLKGVSFARLGDSDSSRAQFGTARSLLREDEPLGAELTYQLAASDWMERRLDRASKTLDKLSDAGSSNLKMQAQIVRGAIASANEKLPQQGAILLSALRELQRDGVEVYLYGMLVTHIAALAVELPSTELRDAAVEHIGKVPWTPDIADLHFHAARAVAWRHALEGDEFNAFRRLKEALAVASSPAWRVAALTDRAYLAAALGEKRWAAQELRDAHEIASTVDWMSLAGEEKLALPVLADLFADRDPSVAIAYVATFRNTRANFSRILSSRRDRRVEALEAYSLGKVQSALGERAEARRLLTQAWTIYSELGIGWRAARAALALAQIDDAEMWRGRAESDLQLYPRSWLSRSIGAPSPRPQAFSSASLESLTTAQRAVFDLLLEGRGTDEIAAALGRSTFTVRNHLKAIFKAFGVTSRPALIVKATQG